MRVFITGASGFIGNRLAHALAGRGHEVVAMNRTPSKDSLLQHERIRICEAGFDDRQRILSCLKDCDVIFHLAGLATAWARDDRDYFRVNVGSTVMMLDLAKQAGVPLMVYTSTTGVLGPSRGNRTVDEDGWREVDFFTPYDSSKYIAEERFLTHEADGVRRVVLQPSRVYGPGILSESNTVTKMIIAFSRGKWRLIPGDGNRIGNYVHIDDVVEGHIRAIERGRDGQRYILGGENVSYSDFFGTLRRVTGSKHFMVHLPLWLIMLVARLVGFLGSLGLTRPFITPGWASKYMHDWALSSEKAREELGYEPRSLEAGVGQTYEWYRSER